MAEISPPRRIVIALAYGAICHALFALGVGSMIVGMYFGLTLGQGRVPWPWAALVNLLLVLQFPLAHSALLTARGRRGLAALAPAGTGKTLATTTYAIVASVQLLALFWLWTPTGIVWLRLDGVAQGVVTAFYAAAWALLIKSILDGGIQLQSGMLGWFALLRGREPRFPDMPTRGTFAIVRQPIYVSFALTLWLVPVWTPDQLSLAVAWTAYCVLAPRLKERRFLKIYGERFAAYRVRVPYWLPVPRKRTDG